MLEKFYQNKVKILKKSQEFFSNTNSLIPKIGCELEFFLLDKNGKNPANIDEVDDFISELKAQKERGISQIEIKTDFTDNLAELCLELDESKKNICNLAQKKNLIASFASQPFLNDCGSSLQFNISLHDKNNKNVFLTDKKIVKNCVNSLLQFTDEMLILLAPRPEDYLRFDFDLNLNLFKQGKFCAPINLSYGVDNRTCAIRFVKSKSQNKKTLKDDQKEILCDINLKDLARLEYRIAAASADCWLSIAAILLALSFVCDDKSVNNFIEKKDYKFIGEQIFGNAFDKQYKLKNFCKNFDDAQKKFLQKNNLIYQKFQLFLRDL